MTEAEETGRQVAGQIASQYESWRRLLHHPRYQPYPDWERRVEFPPASLGYFRNRLQAILDERWAHLFVDVERLSEMPDTAGEHRYRVVIREVDVP